MDNILEMTGIRKEFPGVLALDDVSLKVRPGEVHILLGENGAGKSTLVKVLAGAYERDKGKVVIRDKELQKITPRIAQENGISIIYQELNLVGPMTVAENIFLGREPLRHGQIHWKKLFNDTIEILDSLNLSLNPRALVRDLGVAEQQMVEIAKAFSQSSKIIIMDEPTAVLTEDEINNLFKIVCSLKEDGIAIIYISHRLEEFVRIGDRITVMRDGKTITTVEVKDTAIPELIKLMVGRELKDQYPKTEKTIDETVLEVKNLCRGKVLNDINLYVRKGEILGIAGLVGSGRTEMARAIFGADPIDTGEIYIDGKKITIRSPKKAIDSGIGFVTEDRKRLGLILPLSVAHNMTLANLNAYVKHSRILLKQERAAAIEYVEKMGVKTPTVDQQIVNLSGGNQQKVVLAKWMLSHSKVFIFDEPTRGIDVGAKAEVYSLMNALVKEGAAIIMISSELPEILGMSDRIMVMCRGEFLGELPIAEATQEKILYYAAGGGKHFE
ncbi:MAG: sugar ABC transporter ATP-binding protein [Clostridiales Family XIII bacterium]|jgi:ribose transport system ATP-binding protein|nr:sugar ABC transporter ATP-binding protein [Clostridiales Family XIII bacterium]